MKKILLSLFAVLLSCSALAIDVEIDGINYSLNEITRKASVISKSPTYSGDVGIPSSVTYSDVNYSVTSIGSRAFADCTDFTSIEIPNSVTWIEGDAFNGCSNLTRVTLDSNAIVSKEYGEYQWATGTYTSLGTIFGKQVKEYIIGNSVTTIGYSAFRGCSGLTDIEIPNSVSTISELAFSGCTGLTDIEIPNSVTSIGDLAFYKCSGMTSIICEATIPPAMGTSVFYNVDKSACILCVPAASVNAYKSANQWKDFYNILPYDPTGIEDINITDVNNHKSYFDFGGREIPMLQKGMNIVKKTNGQTIKVFVK